MGKFLVQEVPHPQDIKGAGTLRTSNSARGLIRVIHTSSQRLGIAETQPRIMAVGSISDSKLDGPVNKKGRWEDECIGFTRKDLEDIFQPNEDALVITLRIGGFDVKGVMIDQGSGAEIMYPDLYEGLRLTPEDLAPYDSPLVAFDGTVVMPAG